MKFKWIGGNGFKDLDLVLYKIMTPDDILVKGRVIYIPDDNNELIERIKISGNYVVYVEPPKPKKKKHKPKKDKKQEEEEE